MDKKACIFVDGENFRHTIVELFDEFDKTEYLPKNADWKKFFDWLVSQVDAEAKRLRTYWYVTEKIDFYPHKLCDPVKDQDKLKSMLSKDRSCKARFDLLQDKPLLEEMKKIVDTLNSKKSIMVRRFSGWEILQSAISTTHRFIEFRKAGAIRYNLFKGELGQEKAVDVKLATDMIMLKNIYDMAIIVSGDQDYVPAVQVIKDMGKHVINVSFEKRNGELLPGGAWRLNQITDWNLKVTYDDFKSFLNFPPPVVIPPTITP